MSDSRISIEKDINEMTNSVSKNHGAFSPGIGNSEEIELMDVKLSPPQAKYFEDLLKSLESNEKDFLEEYRLGELLKNHNNAHVKLLVKAIKAERSAECIEAILCNVTDINRFENGDFGKYLCVIAAICEAKDFQSLKKLFSHSKLKLPSMGQIVNTLITELDPKLFHKWFDYLYELEKFDVNKRYDGKERLLESAVWIANNDAIQKLCEKGAFIGYKLETYADEDGYLIDKMEPKVLEQIFDSCISSNRINSKSTEFNINFNYINFATPQDQGYFSYDNELIPIMCIFNSEELLHLLKHPLITSFMTLKWLSVSRLFYLNFILYCFYGLSMVAYIIFKCEQFEDDSLFVRLPWYLGIFGIVYLIIREAIQFIRNPWSYLTTVSNYFEAVLIALSIKTLTMDFEPYNSKITVVLTVLFMATELCLLVGYLPILSISTHMLMLEEVLKTFLKSFTLYSIFVLMFALCFYILFGTEMRKLHNIENTSAATNATETSCAKDDFKMENVFKSIVKTMAMVVGELDFENLNFQGAFGYILFFLFVICMTVVLMNLLNGLAVSDIQTIKEQAELNEMICRAKLLTNYSSSILLDRCRGCYLIVQPNVPGFPNKTTFPVKDCISFRGSDIMKNPQQKTWYNRLFNEENVRHIWDSLNGKCTAMGSSIVKKARQILNEENSEDQESQLNNIKGKVEVIEENVKKILEKLNE